MIRTLGCLPALIRPPFRCSTVPLQGRARNGTTTATLRVIYPATNPGPGRATQQRSAPAGEHLLAMHGRNSQLASAGGDGVLAQVHAKDAQRGAGELERGQHEQAGSE